MAFISTKINIPQVAKPVNVQLYFPTDLPDHVGNKVKGVITLLHGLYGTGEDWMMMTAACRYAADNGYILVCPNAENSFYIDMAYGSPFYTIITEYLPAQLQSIFHIPTARECNYIAGLSMGGYGALRIGLLHPERYAAIGSFSGAVDMVPIAQGFQNDPVMRPLITSILGEGANIPPGCDLMQLLPQVAALPKAQQPRIFVTCGRQDEDETYIHTQNQHLCAVAGSLPLDFCYREWDGVHEWNFWDRSLAEFIGFVQNSDYGARKCGDWAAPAETACQ